MGFGEAVRTVLKDKYATFSGRASRSEFWWFQLFYVLCCLAFGVLLFLAGAMQMPAESAQGGFPLPVIAVFIIAGILGLAALVPMIALQVRRLHDRNMSGWWYLGVFVAGFIPFLNFAASIALVVIDVLKGTDGPNKYGPDPLSPYGGAEVFA